VHSQKPETKLHPHQNQWENSKGQQNNPNSNQIQDTTGNQVSLQEKTVPQPATIPTASGGGSSIRRHAATSRTNNKIEILATSLRNILKRLPDDGLM